MPPPLPQVFVSRCVRVCRLWRNRRLDNLSDYRTWDSRGQHPAFSSTWPPFCIHTALTRIPLFSHIYTYFDRPASDDFALVPRAFSDHFFSALSTFYACDDESSPSWPPSNSWWSPHCDGKGFEESVLFQYLHASGVDYRMYPMFDYVLAHHVTLDGGRQSGKQCGKRKSGYFTSTCLLLDAWGLLPPSLSG